MQARSRTSPRHLARHSAIALTLVSVGALGVIEPAAASGRGHRHKHYDDDGYSHPREHRYSDSLERNYGYEFYGRCCREYVTPRTSSSSSLRRLPVGSPVKRFASTAGRC